MFQPVVVVLEHAAGVVWWINKYALYLSPLLMFHYLECEQIIGVNQNVIEDVALAAARSMVAPLVILDENARLEPGLSSLPIQVSSSCCFLLLTISPPLQATTRQRTV